MTKPNAKPGTNPNTRKGPITPTETREWRDAMLEESVRIRNGVSVICQELHELLEHFTKAVLLRATIGSEPINPPAKGNFRQGGVPMPQDPIQGTIPPNSRAVVNVVPLSADNVPTALDGNLQAIFMEPAVFTIDSTDPLNMILKVDPPADLDAQPQTHTTISDDADSDPTLEITFDWQKGVVVIKAVQFQAVISSEPLS